MLGWAQTPPVHGSVGWECGGPSAEMIWADSRAADCSGARVKGKIFQVEIVWWITQGLDWTIKHSALGGDLIRQEAEESWSVAGRSGGWGGGEHIVLHTGPSERTSLLRSVHTSW